ncbi:MAG: hypothetical protein R3200_09460 [Xanthomonadales bacterium]|nr:hypothetical protein [Xanthomonadales bacterium]
MRGIMALDWRTLTLELVVVFVGLFAALQLDQWRERVELEETETRYLQRLQADLVGYRSQLAEMIPLLERNHQAVAHVHASLAANEVLDGNNRQFELGLIYVDMLPSHAPPRAAYEEMVASGMFARLGSEPLKKAVSDLYTYQEISAANFSWWRRTAMDLADRLSHRIELYDSAAQGDDFGVLPNEPERRARYDLEALSDRYIQNGFYWATDIHNDWVNAYRELLAMSDRALAELEEDLALR